MKSRMALSLMASLALACGGDAALESERDSTPAAESRSVALAASEGKGAPKAIASIHLDNGNLVEFFEASNGGVVTETGPASTDPTVQRTGERNFVRLWQRLAPGKPVPEALANLQARLIEDSQPQAQVSGQPKAAPQVTWGGGRGITAMTPSGCNNRCCDYEWLVATFGACNDGDWLMFNKGWSYANATNIKYYQASVCSASGTSNFKFKVAGSPSAFGNWDIPEGYYRSALWVADFTVLWPCWGYCLGSMTSSVNSPSDMHLHTHCGFVL